MTVLDYTGREIRKGDFVRHAYQPNPPRQEGCPSGRGSHHHNLFGVCEVADLHIRTVSLKWGPGGGWRLPGMPSGSCVTAGASAAPRPA